MIGQFKRSTSTDWLVTCTKKTHSSQHGKLFSVNFQPVQAVGKVEDLARQLPKAPNLQLTLGQGHAV